MKSGSQDQPQRERLRIAHVVLSDRPWGAVRVVLELSRQQSRTSSVWVAMNRDLLESTKLSDGVIPVPLPLEFGPNWPSVLGQIRMARKFIQAARMLEIAQKANSWDLVHFHLPNAYILSLLTDARMNKVFTVHGRLFENRILRKCERRLAGAAVGDSLASVIGKNAAVYLPEGAHFRLIPNGVDIAEVVARSNEYKPPEIAATKNGDRRRPLLVFPHSLVKRKGQDLLISSMGRILETHAGAIALLTGSGPDADALKKLAREAGVADCVIFAGFKENVYPYIRAADVVLSHLSMRWPFPSIVELEALSLGRPVVTMYTEEKLSLYGNAACYLKSEDPESLAVAVDAAIESDTPAMVARRKEAAERLSWESAAAKYWKMYEESLVRHTRA